MAKPIANGKQLDILTKRDYEMFSLATKDINYWSNYYLRSPESGTTYSKAAINPPALEHYNNLKEHWLKNRDGTKRINYLGIEYKIGEDINGDITFFYPHGIFFQPWQKMAFHTPQPEITIVGGFGCVTADTRISNMIVEEMYAQRESSNTVSYYQGWTWETPISRPIPTKKDAVLEVLTRKGRQIKVSPDHRFLTPAGYIRASRLQTDTVLCVYNSEACIVELDYVKKVRKLHSEWVFDFIVPGPNNYVANDFFNHNSGKTSYSALTLMAYASMFPGFRGFAIAPKMLQAMEVYKQIRQMSTNTPWNNRWVTRASEFRNPGYTLQNDYIGVSTIEMMPLEGDITKIRTLEADVIIIDQAEKFLDLDDVVREAGSRLRGMTQGRPRIGKLILIANADENDALWYRFDQAQVDPKTYFSLQVNSSENSALSNDDIENLKRRTGGDEQSIRQWLGGERPLGKGEHFSGDMIMACTDLTLNKSMDWAIEQKHSLSPDDPKYKWFGQFYKEEKDRAGIFRWEMPPDTESGRKYCVIADPGQGDPPGRNAPCIMVWDITDFPKRPAVLRAFHWIYANSSYWPFITEFTRYVTIYKAHGNCAFDSTGTQKAFDELVFEQSENKLMVRGLDTSGINAKYASLNALKFFMGKGMLRFPSIPSIRMQLSHYVLPDGDIPQDIVMTMAMSAHFFREYYYHEPINNYFDPTRNSAKTSHPPDRYKRPVYPNRR